MLLWHTPKQYLHIAKWEEKVRLVQALLIRHPMLLDCKPINAMAKRDYDELKNFWWMDVYAYGRYPKAAMAYLKKKGYAPEILDEDMEILKKAASERLHSWV